MDIVYIGLAGLCWLAVAGLAWGCHRLQGPGAQR
jgi:hypothetical protein